MPPSEQTEDDKKVVERFKETYSLAEQFLCGIEACLKDEKKRETSLCVEARLLRLAVKGAYDDIERYKEYHLRNTRSSSIERLSNSVKRSAYMCKWICKFKPLREEKIPNWYNERGHHDRTGKIISTINEKFSLQLSQGYIGGELKKAYGYRTSYIKECVYDLSYRNLGEDALLHIFNVIYEDVKAGYETSSILFPSS